MERKVDFSEIVELMRQPEIDQQSKELQDLVHIYEGEKPKQVIEGKEVVVHLYSY